MTKKSMVSLEKLDTDLKNYKSNSIKESIRRGYDDLGEFYLDCGDLMNALKSFTRSRDYCTSAKHVITMCLNVIKVYPFFILKLEFEFCLKIVLIMCITLSYLCPLTGIHLPPKLVSCGQFRCEG